MAHFAELDKDNKVIRVIVIDNIKCLNPAVSFEVAPSPQTLKQISGKTMLASVRAESKIEVKEVDWESESEGISYCEKLFKGGKWIKTSYNGNIRKNYAGVGYTYDPVLDAFIPPQPYKSWKLDEKTCRWTAPIPYPEGKEMYSWNEDKQIWEAMK
jgi:hypothetical protein